MKNAANDCCHTKPKQHTGWGTAARATVHCMTGCAIGETMGMILGAAIGFSAFERMALATFLAFVIGMTLAACTVVRREQLSFARSLKIVFWGEVASITAMEITMNATDYYFGGAQASLDHWRFWLGLIIMLPAGYIVALPVNYLLIKTAIKKPCCH